MLGSGGEAERQVLVGGGEAGGGEAERQVLVGGGEADAREWGRGREASAC